MSWQAGLAKAKMTPETAVWLAGYGSKRVPDGIIHDLWIKTLALADANGHRGVIVTTDHMGMPRAMYERICAEVQGRCGLAKDQLLLVYSHNHCGPILTDDLVDYVPSEPAHVQLVAEYTDAVTGLIVGTVVDALADLQPATLSRGRGVCRFAVNRRNNPESQVAAQLAAGEPLQGPVDHSVPVLAVRNPQGALRAVLFGYACHPTTMSFSKWCGDYPGFAQLAIEASHPGAMALFAAGCGADQNPLPRRQLHLCERYGRMLAAAVEEVLLQPLTPVPARLDCAAREVALDFAEVVGEKTWREAAESSNAVRARWAQRWLSQLRQNPDLQLPASYPYPVQVWLLGGAPLISLGGEAVVDYAIRCRELFGDTTWVLGYAHVLVAYIPSRRVWLEGGYEGGPYLSEYGHAAERWADGVEARILDTVTELLGNLRNAARG